MISRFGDLRFLQLSLRDVGPFRDEVRRFRFMGTLGEDEDGNRRGEAPANLYALFAMNGKGKTTILRTIYSLMKLTGDGFIVKGVDPWVFEDGAAAQLDLRVTLTVDDMLRTTLISIWYGADEPLAEWSEQEIDEVAEASEWAKIGFVLRGGECVLSRGSNELGRNVRDSIESGRGEYPKELYGLSTTLPSVLFFPATRSVSAPVGIVALYVLRDGAINPRSCLTRTGQLGRPALIARWFGWSGWTTEGWTSSWHT